MHTVRRYIGQGTAAALLCIMHVRYILFSKYEHTRVRHLRCRRDLTNAAQPRHEMHTFKTTSSKCYFFLFKMKYVLQKTRDTSTPMFSSVHTLGCMMRQSASSILFRLDRHCLGSSSHPSRATAELHTLLS